MNANKAILGLSSTAGLVLDADTRLAASNGHAVNFRQVFDGLEAAEGGLVTVGITGSAAKRWRVAYVSSSLTRSTSLVSGEIELSPAEGLAQAAQAAGDGFSIAKVTQAKDAAGYESFQVSGLDSLQHVKLVSFPTPRGGVLPAYESLVVNKDAGEAFRIYVDARDGRLLARFPAVFNLADQELVPVTIPFSGTLLDDPEQLCSEARAVRGRLGRPLPAGVRERRQPGPGHPPEALPGCGARRDVADVGFTPEAIQYAPTGGVPAGNYFAEVCVFGTPLEPRTYTGTFTIDDTPAPHPYLARWQVFPANPPLAPILGDPWGNPSTDTRELWCWDAGEAADCDKVVGNLASRAPWDHNVRTNTPTLTTIGNNAVTATSWVNSEVPSPPGYRPTSPSRDYVFPWTNDWFNGDCEPTPGAPGATWDDSAAVTNLFVAHNRMHDWSYFLGFTERNWNGQDVNFGLTETWRENDPVIGDSQAGAPAGVRDNANMYPMPEGLSAITNMYMWQALPGAFYPPCVDGDYDMGVIGHEYGHLIENRMIGKGGLRSGHHAGAMGESHGDLMAMEYLNGNDLVPTGDENRYAVGTYATGNKVRAIRNYGMNFPMSGGVPEPSKQLMINALNFSDMGYDLTGPQVHADGEIWSKVNFDIRKALRRSTTASSRRTTPTSRSRARTASCLRRTARATGAGCSSCSTRCCSCPRTRPCSRHGTPSWPRT